MWPVL